MKPLFCYVCGHKTDEKHGWLVYVVAITKGDVCCYVLSITRCDISLIADEHQVRPACGNNCMQKLVERWAHTGSLEPAHKVRRPA